MRDSLPEYLRRRAATAADKADKALVELAKTGYERAYLEKQWENQKAAETSVRSRTSSFTAWTCAYTLTDSSTRLRKALESVLALQERVDAIDDAIRDTEANLPRGSKSTSAAANKTIRALKVAQLELTHQAEQLHATLKIPDEFEEIRGLGLEFTAVLLQAYEAKRACRTLITNRFQEWAYLDGSAGGKGGAVGTSFVLSSHPTLALRCCTRFPPSTSHFTAVPVPFHSLFTAVPDPDPSPSLFAAVRDSYCTRTLRADRTRMLTSSQALTCTSGRSTP